MPWTCPNPSCARSIALDTVLLCPHCGHNKTAWSFEANTQGDLQRAFVIPRRKLECRRGELVPTEEGAPHIHLGVSWHRTKEASVLTKVEARELMDAGELPDPYDLLNVRMRPAKAGVPWDLSVVILFEKQEAQELAFLFEEDLTAVNLAGHLSAKFLCVHGPEPVDDLQFPYIHILDVTESTAQGYAPTLEVSKTKSKPIPVQLRPGGKRIEFRVRIVDDDDEPVAGQPFALEAEGARSEGETNPEGVVDTFAPAKATEGMLTLWPGEPDQVFWLLGVGETPTRPKRETLYVHRKGGLPPTFEVKLVDNDGAPIAGEAYQLEAEGELHDGVTTGQGLVKAEAPAAATEGLLTLWPGTPEAVAWRLGVGANPTRPIHSKLYVHTAGPSSS